jgi:NADPH:quinone reductase-like Zn-dependent oxidoreductase
VQSLGAAEVIDYHATDFAKRVSDVDLVLDLVGGTTQARSWSVLKRGGILVSTVSKPDTERGNEAQATGKHFATRSDGPQLAALGALHASGDLRIHIDSVFSLPEPRPGKEHERPCTGKVVLDMAA